MPVLSSQDTIMYLQHKIVERDTEIERLRAALENAEQFLKLFVAGYGGIKDATYTLSHIREALRGGGGRRR